MNRLLAMIRARLLEILRDRSAMIWNFLFAPALVIGMATVLARGPQPVFQVGVLGDLPLTAETHPFFAAEATRFHHEPDLQRALDKVGRHSIDLLLDPAARPLRYWINADSEKGRLLQRLLRQEDPEALPQTVTGSQVGYADWLVPGLLGMNLMFSCLFAIGHVLVRYRKSGYLKRLNGTPLRAVEFIGAQMFACLIVVVVVAAVIFLVCNLSLHLRMEGRYLDLLIVSVLGAMSMISMSLMMSARIASEELSGGLLNLVAWPMVLLSGVFFSLDAVPAPVRVIADLLPLTHLLAAARAVMIDGAGLADIAQPLLALAAMTAVFLALGSFLFRWTQD